MGFHTSQLTSSWRTQRRLTDELADVDAEREPCGVSTGPARRRGLGGQSKSGDERRESRAVPRRSALVEARLDRAALVAAVTEALPDGFVVSPSTRMGR